MDTSVLIGEKVNTNFPGEPRPQSGAVIGAGGPWRVEIRWDDDSTSTLHIEDVIFE